MLNQHSKLLLPVSGVTLAAMFAYTLMAGDHLGIALFAAVAIAAFGGAIVYAATREPTAAAVGGSAAGDDEPVQVRPVTAPRPVGGAAWPVAAGASAALIAISLVQGAVIAGAGAALGLVTLIGWLAAVGTERTARKPVNLMPFGIPVLGFAFIASLMFLMSRVLLAVSELTATWVALFVAAAILGIGSLFAMRPNLSSRSMVAMLAAGAVLMTGGGLVAASVGEREIEHHGEEHAEGGGEALVVGADNLAFDVEEIELHPDSEVTISFQNNEAQPHNIAIYTDEDASEEIFVGDIVTGPITVEYHFTSPEPGTYFFRCDVHPNMRGTVTVA